MGPKSVSPEWWGWEGISDVLCLISSYLKLIHFICYYVLF